MKPRIALVTSYFPSEEEPYRGQSTYQALRHLADRAEWCAFVPYLTYPAWYNPAQTRYRVMKVDQQARVDIPARYFRYGTAPLVGRPLNGEFAYRKVRQAVRDFAPDLILSYWLYPDGYASVRLGRQLRIPAIVGALGSDLRRIDDWATKYWTGWTLRGAAHTIAVSGELAERAVAMGSPRERTHAILNGYDEAVFYPGHRLAERRLLGIEPDAEVVLYVGSLIPSKGIPELMTAFRALAARRPRLMLVCGGEGPLAADMRRNAEEAGLGARLLLPGKLSGQQVRQWMVASNLFCLPSHSEGCPNVVVEALACGRAVVASRVGGIPELVNARNGVLTPVRDAAALETALAQTLERSWDQTAVAATYQRSWHEVAEDTWDVCQLALAAGRAHRAA